MYNRKFWTITTSGWLLTFTIKGLIDGPVINRDTMETSIDTVIKIREDINKDSNISEIHIVIKNSSGGSAFIGSAIHDILKKHPAKKFTFIEGKCCSAATLVALAGDKIYMTKKAFFFLHQAQQAVVIGGSTDLFDAAKLLKKIERGLNKVYVEKTKMSYQQIDKLCAKETWLDAEKALKLGFIDGILDEILFNPGECEDDNSEFAFEEALLKSPCMDCAYLTYQKNKFKKTMADKK